MTNSLTARPLRRQHMPGDFRLSLARYTGRGTPEECRIPDDFGPAQSMQGFEKTYRNIVDYIVRITYRIWEDRDVEYIGKTYAANSIVFDDYGLQRGSAKIVTDTRATLAAYSGIKLLADEVIWAGDDEIGYHTSHRVIIRGNNDGDSKFGPATGQDVDVMVIANCVALNNEIFLEHVLYNTSAMLPQLGVDTEETIARLLEEPPAGWPRDADTWAALRRSASPQHPLSVSEPVDGFDIDRFARATLNELWNQQNERVLDTAFSDDFHFRGATNRQYDSIDAYARFLGDFARSFSHFAFTVDEVYWMGNGEDGYLVAARWSADATYAGNGLYGTARKRPVQVWGITQFDVRNERVVREWTLFNELDLIMQIRANS